MNHQTYKITCKKCKGTSKINIVNGDNVIYVDQTPVISSRLRSDMKWGFECICGNDSRIAKSEQDQIGFLVQQGSETAINAIIKSLKIKDESKFSMEVM